MDWSFVKEPSRTRPMSWQNIQKVHELFENHKSKHKLRNLCIIKLMIATGCRPGEVCKARQQHFDLSQKIWYVPPENEKTRKTKVYPLNNGVVEYLAFYFRVAAAKIEQHDGFIIYSQKNNGSVPYLDEAKFTSYYNQLTTKAGLDERMPGKKTHSNLNKLYSIRAGIFVYLRNLGYKPEEILCLSQHSHLNTLQRFYIRYDSDNTNQKLISETELLIKNKQREIEELSLSNQIKN